MSDTIKTILSIIGVVILSVFIALCISICIPSFRNKVNNALGGVPENEYNQSIIEKNNLYLEIETYSQKINNLNDEKQALLNKIAELDLTIAENQQLLLEYRQEINNLNSQISELTHRLNSISVQLGDASVEYICTNYNIFLPFFDDYGNYTGHGAYCSNNNGEMIVSGYYIKDRFQYEFNDMLDRIERAKNSSFRITLDEFHNYNVVIGNSANLFNAFDREYTINTDCSVSLEISFDNEIINIADLETLIQNDCSYIYNFEYNASFDSNECVDTLKAIITINTVS